MTRAKIGDSFFVYEHRCPRRGRVVYIGSGCKGRAWQPEGRAKEHQNWIFKLLGAGTRIDRLVFIVADKLSEAAARKAEQERLGMCKPWPVFNKQGAPKELSFDQLELAVHLHYDLKMTCQQIAHQLKESPAVVENALLSLGYNPRMN